EADLRLRDLAQLFFERRDLVTAGVDLAVELRNLLLVLADARAQHLLALSGVTDDVADAYAQRLERALDHAYDEIGVLVEGQRFGRLRALRIVLTEEAPERAHGPSLSCDAWLALLSLPVRSRCCRRALVPRRRPKTAPRRIAPSPRASLPPDARALSRIHRR